MKRIYVGNLPFDWGEEEVRELFSAYGEAYRVDLISDKATGRPRGFGFVEMDADSADAAIEALDGSEHGGRELRVKEEYPKDWKDEGGGDSPPKIVADDDDKSSGFVVLEDREEIAAAEEKFKQRLFELGSEPEMKVLGFQGGNDESEATYIAELDLWAAFSYENENNRNHYWNCFGYGDLSSKNTNIVVEINPPHEGINRKVGGGFVRDEEGSLYLFHRGKVNVGSTSGIGKTEFFNFYSGSPTEVKDGSKTSKVILVCKLDSEELLEDLERFVAQIRDFKDTVRKGQTGRGTKYWWVTQEGYDRQRKEGFFCLPKIANNQHRRFEDLQLGDVIFHESLSIRALGRVKSLPEKRPLPDWPDAFQYPQDHVHPGYYCEVEYFDLEIPISDKEIPESLRRLEGNGVFKVDGNLRGATCLRAASSEFVNQLTEHFADRWPPGSPLAGSVPESYSQKWFFQAKPEMYDLAEELGQDWLEGSEGSWTAQAHLSKYEIGDEVILWQTGDNAGIYGLAEITGEVFVRDANERYTGNENEKGIPLRLTRILDEPLLRAQLINAPGLEDLNVIRGVMGTNFSVTQKQWNIVMELIDGSGEPPIGYTIEQALEELFCSRNELERYLGRLESKKNLVLTGPPGVGKTFFARRLAWLLNGSISDSDSRIEFLQFHQSFAYEDFVRGYRPTEEGGFELKDGPFLRFCQKAREEPDEQFVLIIDEINRGNLSRIFGELLMLIEKDKRSEAYAVSLAYPREDEVRFFVPENVHIIGTMNTADRSLAMVDYALRRRFAFVDLRPKFSEGKFKAHLEGQGVEGALVNHIIDSFTELNRHIEESADLGRGFCIGHSYFCNRGSVGVVDDAQWYREIIETEIDPLLENYWFDDPERVKTRVEELGFRVDS